MTDKEKAAARLALEVQIAKEREELANVPAEPVYVGPICRCHFCGQPFPPDSLRSVDTHVKGGDRLACHFCAPF